MTDFKLCEGCTNELVCSDTLRCSKALAPGPGSPAPAEGMYFSDRCRFCGEYSEKAVPKICVTCWQAIKDVAALYGTELFPAKQGTTKAEG